MSSKFIYSGQRTLRKFKNHNKKYSKKPSNDTTEEMRNLINESDNKQPIIGAQNSNKISSLLGNVGPPSSFNSMSHSLGPHALEQGMEFGNNQSMSSLMGNQIGNKSEALMGNPLGMGNPLMGNSIGMGNSLMGNSIGMGNPLMGNSIGMGNQSDTLMGNQLMGNSAIGNTLMGNQLMGNSAIGNQMSSFLGTPKHTPTQFVPPQNHKGLDNKIQINPF
jgi:hypothetical protein